MDFNALINPLTKKPFSSQEELENYIKLTAVRAATIKPKFGLTEKGVFTYKTGGQGFPASLSPAQALAIVNDSEFKAYVEEHMEKAKALRKERMETEEYKQQAALLSEQRKAFTANKVS